VTKQQELGPVVSDTEQSASKIGTTPADQAGNQLMKIIGAVVLTSLVLLPVRWQPGMTATNDPKTEKVVDASGNLRVPSDYRTAYQFLGSWAVAADQGPGSKEIHLVYGRPARRLRTG
jgi:hypothetical protein